MTDMLTGPPPAARWWRSLFDTSDDALVVCDPRGTTLAASPRSAHLSGLTHARQVSAHALRDALTPATATKVAAILARPDARPETLSPVALKTGCFSDGLPPSRAAAQLIASDHVGSFYNRRRRQSSLGYLSPAEFENHLSKPSVLHLHKPLTSCRIRQPNPPIRGKIKTRRLAYRWGRKTYLYA